MLYKTLIIFDTNKIRHTDYVGFELGGDYVRIKKFISENNLENWVKLAIPEYVIEEVKQQKFEQYEKDLVAYKEVVKKFSSLGIIKKQGLANFDIKGQLHSKAQEYINNEDVKILRLKKEDYSDVLERVMGRALEKQLPFKRNDKHSDMGFKDVLIWETILHNKGAISWHDNVFYYSGDNGFAECKLEFEKVHDKNFEFFNSIDFLLEKLLLIYADPIENNKIFSLIKSSYFTDRIKEYIDSVGVWEDLDGDECAIVNIDIVDKCTDFEKIDGNEEDGEGATFKITSRVFLYLEKEDSDGRSGESDTDVYVITTIDENNDFIDFEIE